MDKDSKGSTVLHKACHTGKLELAQYLVDNFSDMLTIRDKTGRSPYLVAGFSGSVELVKFLISWGCDVMDKDSEGSTVLHKACHTGKLELAQYLVEKYPDMLAIRNNTGQSPYLVSGFSGSVEIVKFLISRGCDVMDKDSKGSTVLHKACHTGKLELAQYLVEKYPDMLAIRNNTGQSPYLVSGFSGSVELVKFLISRGCDVMDKDSKGSTVLHKACGQGKLELTQYLVEKYPDMLAIRNNTGQSPYHVAGFSGSVELVKFLISQGCDVMDMDSDGWAVLHYACDKGKLELAKYLVESCQDLLAIRNNRGQSPYLTTGFSGSVELVKFLISRGCDVMDKDSKGSTVLHKACHTGKLELAQYLVDNFSDMLTIRDKTGRSPYLVAGFSGSVELVKFLISWGCDVMDKDSEGSTVLHKACHTGKLELAQYLVEKYPDMLAIRNNTGQSPYLVSGFSWSVELVKFLISRGCDVMDKDSKGSTVLHKACGQGKLELTQYLVEKYPDMLAIRNNTGQSPYHVAGFSGSVELVKFLISQGCDVTDKDSEGSTVLHKACDKGKLGLAKYLVESCQDLLAIRNNRGQSPYLTTGFSGSVELVKFLISRGCDVMDKDSEGSTVLHKACHTGKLELAQYLVDNFSDMLTIRDKTGQSPYLVAGFSGSVELVKFLISCGCDVMDKDSKGSTVLHKACATGKLELAQYLVESCPDLLTIRNNTGQSPYLVAGFSGSVELVKFLISRGCDVMDKDSKGSTVLHKACDKGKLELAQYLVESCPDLLAIRHNTCQSPYLVAGFSGSVELIKFLISRGCDVMDKDSKGLTVLHKACHKGKLALAQYLVEKYPDMLAIRNNTGQSPYLVSGFSGSVELVKFLISRGCDVMDKDSEGWAVLHKACHKGKLALAQYLVEKYPDMLTIRNKGGRSPYLVAGYSGSVELVKFLISQGCDVRNKDSNGQTVLHNACQEGKLELAQYLVENYSDMLTIRDNAGRSPYVVAGYSGSVELVNYLTSKGCDVMEKSSNGWTVLHNACKEGKLELVQHLVENYPDMLTIRDKAGKTPYLATGFSGSVELVKFLISRGCDVRDKDSEGWTVLHNACDKGKLELTQYFVEKYSDLLTIRDKTGRSPHLVAGYSGSVELVKFLISRGCDVKDKDSNGQTVLHKACNKGKLELAQYLVENHSDMLTIRDKAGQSPYLTVGFSGSVELVKFFIARGCDVMDKDSDGWTVLHKVCQGGKVH